MNLETTTEIIANITTFTAVPTLLITLVKYVYDKNKDFRENAKKGFLPLYDYFFKSKFRKEFYDKEIMLLTCTRGKALIDIIKEGEIFDKSVLPYKMVSMLNEYEFYMDVITTGLEYINGCKKEAEQNDDVEELQMIEDFEEKIQSYYVYGIDIPESYLEPISNGEVFLVDYQCMVEKSLLHIVRLHNSICKYVFKVMGVPKYHLAFRKRIYHEVSAFRKRLRK